MIFFKFLVTFSVAAFLSALAVQRAVRLADYAAFRFWAGMCGASGVLAALSALAWVWSL